MVTVIFEVIPKTEGRAEYLAIAASLRDYLSDTPGFISIERFQSLTNPDKILSLSFWKDEAAVNHWRNLEEHRMAQAKGRVRLFKDYRIRVGNITRDYSMSDRGQAPQDSRKAHDSENL